MWISDRLYKLLPYLYAGGGVACLLLLGTDGVELVSAALLFAAAILTTVWRLREQGQATKRKPYRRVPPRKF